MVPVEMIVVMILSTPLRMARAHLSTSLCRARPAKREREGEKCTYIFETESLNVSVRLLRT